VDVEERQDRITELFDKYNLLTLPVIDAEGKLAGVITADEIISLLREKYEGKMLKRFRYQIAIFFGHRPGTYHRQRR
jgi:Mg/Co/Ni transporter MgtE